MEENIMKVEGTKKQIELGIIFEQDKDIYDHSCAYHPLTVPCAKPILKECLERFITFLIQTVIR